MTTVRFQRGSLLSLLRCVPAALLFASSSVAAQGGPATVGEIERALQVVEGDLGVVVTRDVRAAIIDEFQSAAEGAVESGIAETGEVEAVTDQVIADYLAIELDPSYEAALSLGAILRSQLGAPTAGAPRIKRFGYLHLDATVELDAVQIDQNLYAVSNKYLVPVGEVAFDGLADDTSVCPQDINIRAGGRNVAECP